MSVTKRHVWLLWLRGSSIADLMAHYGKTLAWIESAQRKYMGRTFQ